MQEGLKVSLFAAAIQNTTMNDVSSFISSVGFPIVVCLLMIYQQQKMSDSYIEIVNSLKELISDNTKAINLIIKGVMTGETKQDIKQDVSDNK